MDASVPAAGNYPAGPFLHPEAIQTTEVAVSPALSVARLTLSEFRCYEAADLSLDAL